MLRLIPDSGADRLVLFTHAELPSLVAVDVGLLKSATGMRAGAAGCVSKVSTWARSGSTIRTRRCSRAPSTDMALGDGLLPLHLFARVTINGPGRYLVVER